MKHFRTILAILILNVFSPLTHHAQESPSGALEFNEGYQQRVMAENPQFDIDSCGSLDVSYCIPEGASPIVCTFGIPWPHIINVRIGDIDNASGCGVYSCFADKSTSIEAGTRYYGRISMAEIGITDTYQYLYYVDWNADGDFDDQDEGRYIFNSGSSPNYYTSFSIDVPDFVSPGEKRLRIAGFNDPSYIELDACNSEFPGEVEDYTLVVSDPISSIHSTTTGSKAQLNIYPNPATNHIFVSGLPFQVMGEIVIYSSNGDVASRKKGILTDQMRVDVSNLDQGFYVAEVRTQDYAGRLKLMIVR